MTNDGRPPAPPGPVIADRLAALHGSTRNVGNGIYLGFGAGGWAWAEPERSTLVLGPSRSGKTSSLVIPNVLAAPGAVVSTSTKPDVLDATVGARATCGAVLVFDPSGTVEVPPGALKVGWSPVVTSQDWDVALSVASAMVQSSHPVHGAGGSQKIETHWSERASALLAPLLHAAALDDVPMRGVLSWVDRHNGSEALTILSQRVGEHHLATDVLAGILTTDGRELSGIWSTASGALAAYRSEAALASTEPPYLDAAAFCRGAHTLYICAAGRHQRLAAPLVVGIVSDVRDAAYDRARQGVADPPVLLALDEVANIAPLPDLPALVSEGAGQGLLTLACLQDLSQGRHRWGPEAASFLSLFGTTVVLPGIADRDTLRALSELAGDHEVLTRTVSRSPGPGGRLQTGLSVSGVVRPRLAPDVAARGRDGFALALDHRNRLGWVGLTPARTTPPWRDLVDLTRARERMAATGDGRARAGR
ncbi:MAG TPA: type IV secretory system conjugative DNA transfer family protein [Acidimicrobiales bacterium]|nr:type IV secretory system conjugative DNA transfer family protein [Acidimicrobiales bacterium]